MRKVITLSIVAIIFLLGAGRANSETLEEIRSKISNKNKEIEQLEKEIENIGNNISETIATKKTLNSELKVIEGTRKKLSTDINVTGKKIEVTNLNIRELEKEIAEKTTKIRTNEKSIGESLKFLNRIDKESFIEKLLSEEKISATWNDVVTLENLREKIKSHVESLNENKKELEASANALNTKKKNLVSLVGELGDKKKIADQNLTRKNRLLAQTKNQESLYKKQLAAAEAKKQAVESELFQYESMFKVIIDPESLPAVGSHVLKWPLANVIITQYFGDTEFSRANYQVYNGKGHNGIDMRAPVGTKLFAAGDGVVVGTGDTDPICYGASYGKWIMIEHGNGLNTIYGHLSLAKVKAGDRVSTGDLIGYTGRSGYATGPHLHFTVAATKGMKIGDLKSKIRGCGTYTVPLGSLNSYLNPLWYI